MARQPVRVIAHFAVRPDRVEEFIQVARDTLVAPTRTEPGCIQYDLWQDAGDATRFAMVETWQSEEALVRHLSQESLQAAVGTLMAMAAEPPTVRRFRSVTGDGAAL